MNNHLNGKNENSGVSALKVCVLLLSLAAAVLALVTMVCFVIKTKRAELAARESGLEDEQLPEDEEEDEEEILDEEELEEDE